MKRTWKSRRALATLVSGALVATGAVALAMPPVPAHAAASVVVSGGDGAALDQPTAVTVSGSGFQAIQGGFGGIYVLFGWVDAAGSWRPSQGGIVGEDYRYVPDTEARDNAGFQRFIAFDGSDTEGAAHGVMAANGSWSVDMVVPGARFTSRDRDGNESTVDCTAVQCGIITIGAHGVKNANNESFTPIRFGGANAPAAAPQQAATSPDASATGGVAAPDAQGAAPVDAAAASADPAAVAAPGVPATVGYVPESAAAGEALAFTGRGFAPGEQVLAVLDGGVAAAGPLAAGASGEVAGVLQLPTDLAGGTHLLRLEGAGTGQSVESEVQVRASSAALVPGTANGVAVWPYLVLAAALLLVLVLLIIAIVRAVSARRRAKREREAVRQADAPADARAETRVEPRVDALPEAFHEPIGIADDLTTRPLQEVGR